MKKKILSLLLASTMAVGMFAGCSSDEPDSGETTENTSQTETESGTSGEEETNKKEEMDPAYKLVWEDNFDGDSLNRDDWNVELHDPGWVNAEWQSYVDSEENIYLENGELVIQAIKTVDADGNATYTSGRVNTQNKHNFKYGRFEARIKVPSGKGFLPAFWLMAADENLYGQWPKCGEIDIMEVLGDNTKLLHSTIHYGEPHEQQQGEYTLTDSDFSEEYHVFACEWDPSEIRYYCDGELFFTVNDWFSAKEGFDELTYPAPFDQPFYIILNLAVGGSWVGYPDDTTEFGDNAQLRVDYVKVYQKESYDENVKKPEVQVTLRDPDATGNYVINGDFANAEGLEEDGEDWEFHTESTGRGTAEIVNGEMVIKPKTVGDLAHAIQLYQADIPMISGTKYKISFDAYSIEKDRNIIVAITAPTNAWVRYFPDTTVAITPEKKTYEFEFNMTDDTDPNGRIEFNLGYLKSVAEVHISNVRIEKIGEFDMNSTKNVQPDGNYVYNAEFQVGENRMDYWSVDTTLDGVTAAVTNIDNIRELKVSVPDSVAALSDVVVKQDQIHISGGKKYTLAFTAYADADKKITAQIAGQKFDADVTTTAKQFKYEFTTGSDVGISVLEFLVGNAGDLYLDKVSIQEDALLLNGDFSNGMTGFEAYAYNTSDINYVVDNLNEDNAFSIDIVNSSDTDWHIQLKQANIALEKGKTYKVSMDIKSTVDRQVMYTFQHNGAADEDWTLYSEAKVFDVSQDFTKCEMTFTMNSETDEASLLTISMGAVGGTVISEKHTIVIDNIELSVVE